MKAVCGPWWPDTGEDDEVCPDRGTPLTAVEVPVSGGKKKVSEDTIDHREKVRITGMESRRSGPEYRQKM